MSMSLATLRSTRRATLRSSKETRLWVATECQWLVRIADEGKGTTHLVPSAGHDCWSGNEDLVRQAGRLKALVFVVDKFVLGLVSPGLCF
jgi:hypothetical protein